MPRDIIVGLKGFPEQCPQCKAERLVGRFAFVSDHGKLGYEAYTIICVSCGWMLLKGNPPEEKKEHGN